MQILHFCLILSYFIIILYQSKNRFMQNFHSLRLISKRQRRLQFPRADFLFMNHSLFGITMLIHNLYKKLLTFRKLLTTILSGFHNTAKVGLNFILNENCFLNQGDADQVTCAIAKEARANALLICNHWLRNN